MTGIRHGLRAVRLSLISILFGTASIAAAGAVPITPDGAEFTGSLCNAGTIICTNTLSGTGSVSAGSSYLTFGAAPSPSIAASVSGGTAIGWGDQVPNTGFFRSVPSNAWDRSGGYSAIQYYAVISGPDGPVPVDLAFTLALSVTGGTQGAAYITLNPSGHTSPPLRQLSTGASSTDGKTTGHVTDSTISGTLTDTVMANTQFDIALAVQLFSSSNGTGYAMVDPVLFIDPSFAAIDPNYLADYKILLSAQIGNTEVPEPATLAVMGAGLAGAFALRRKRKRA